MEDDEAEVDMGKSRKIKKEPPICPVYKEKNFCPDHDEDKKTMKKYE